MATIKKEEQNARIADKVKLLAMLDRVDAANGHVRSKGMPAKELRALIIAQGVKPEDNIATRELHELRYGGSD
ncbi:MAG TPA: hypothetical protein VGK19_23430 [Capsulimonadaceae bacterium]